jgi:hypothetical protein
MHWPSRFCWGSPPRVRKMSPTGSRVRSRCVRGSPRGADAGLRLPQRGSGRREGGAGRTSPESRLDALQPLVDAHPYLETARRQRGLAWLALAYSHGQYDATRLQRAEADLAAVVKTRPQWGEARSDLGFVKYCQGRIDEAKVEMAEAARLDPTHMGVGIAYAQVLAWSGDTKRLWQKLRAAANEPGLVARKCRDLVNSWGQGSTFSVECSLE